MLYGASGTQGPTYLGIMDALAIAIVIGFKIASSEEFSQKLREAKYHQQRTGFYEPRTCVICGNPLRSRRKYCSVCRPTGRRYPYEENEGASVSAPAPIWTSSRRSGDELVGRTRSADELLGRPRERDYTGNTYSNKSFEDYIGKRKKQKYY